MRPGRRRAGPALAATRAAAACLVGASLAAGCLGAAGLAAAGGALPGRGAADPAAGKPLLVPDRIKADDLVVLAHPDDEGIVAPLLALWALGDRRRVVNVYLTSGEFGTNRVGGVRGPAFGYMRLTELHWTLDRLGISMFHTLGRADGSHAEDPSAVLAAWDRPRTLRELTRHLRLLRPERVLTWFPGPASSHPDHVAAGGAALLAVRAAASPEASPEQMQTEGLSPWTVPEVLLFAQAEKVGYARYPEPPAPLAFEEHPVDVFSPALGRRYTDIAREALREQRSVGAAMGLGRGGAFDEPVRLLRVPPAAAGNAAPPRKTSGLEIRAEGSAAQKFLDAIAEEAAVPDLADAFLPEARAAAGGPSDLLARVTNHGPGRFTGEAALSLPDGWRADPAARALTLDPGASADARFAVTAPAGEGPLYATGEITVRAAGGGPPPARLRLVLRRAPSSALRSPDRGSPGSP